jgi:hypothetical protein
VRQPARVHQFRQDSILHHNRVHHPLLIPLPRTVASPQRLANQVATPPQAVVSRPHGSHHLDLVRSPAPPKKSLLPGAQPVPRPAPPAFKERSSPAQRMKEIRRQLPVPLSPHGLHKFHQKRLPSKPPQPQNDRREANNG